MGRTSERFLFSKVIILFLGSIFLFSCTKNDPNENHRTIELSQEVDSLLSDTTRIDKFTDSLRHQFYRMKEDTLAIDFLNRLFARLPRSQKLIQKEAFDQSVKYNYRCGKLYARINGLQLVMAKSDLDSIMLVYDSLLIETRKFGYKNLEAGILGMIGTIYQHKYQLDKADSVFDIFLNISTKYNLHEQIATALTKKGQVCLVKYKYEEALDYFKQSIEEAKLGNDDKTIAMGYGVMGEVYRMQSKNEEAIAYYKKAAPYAEKSGAYNIAINCIGYSAECYTGLGDYQKAIEMDQEALAIAEKYGIEAQTIAQIIRIAQLYANMHEEGRAEALYRKAEKLIHSRTRYTPDMILISMGLSNIYFNQKNYKECMYYNNLALKLCNDIGDKLDYPVFKAMEGDVLRIEGKYNEALSAFSDGLKVAEEIKAKAAVAAIQRDLSKLYLDMRMPAQAKKYAKSSYENSLEMKSPTSLNSASEVYYRALEMEGDITSAYKILKIHKQLNDSFISDKNFKQFSAREYEGKANYLKEEQASKDKLYKAEKERKDAEIKQQRTVQRGLIIGATVLLILMTIIFRSLQENKKKNRIITEQKLEVENQKHIVEEKQKEIVDSINYAKRIQLTLLAHKEVLDDNLGEHFLIFKPKDIVSGDFYWATKKDDLFFLAVCDSTGHGVPGAFMCLLNIGFLSEAINENHIHEPNKVLDYVRERLIRSISKDGQKDGFDGILVCFNKKSGEITYAAANNAPVLIRNGEYVELPADRMPVGKGERAESFKLYKLDHTKEDTLYLYTDGFADQFGGPKGKKFMYKRMNTLAAELSSRPLEDQKTIMIEEFENWKGHLEQIDDVCVIGIKI